MMLNQFARVDIYVLYMCFIRRYNSFIFLLKVCKYVAFIQGIAVVMVHEIALEVNKRHGQFKNCGY